MKGTKSCERAAKQAARERVERRKTIWMLVGIVLLMVGAGVADYLLIQWGKYVRHRQQYHGQGATNNAAGTNRAGPSGGKVER